MKDYLFHHIGIPILYNNHHQNNPDPTCDLPVPGELHAFKTVRNNNK